MRNRSYTIRALVTAAVLSVIVGPVMARTRTISLSDYTDKLKGSWVGQMAGVTWGAPTEFRSNGAILPEEGVPQWAPGTINDAYGQDDLYVEIPFIQAMKEHGVNCSWTQFGEHFRDTGFGLWHANNAGRENLRRGIPAPDSGHFRHNKHCDDIDWQIEADMVGALCPGLYMPAVDISWRAGHVMCYGDGVYGGVAVAAMHAAAFFAKDVDEIVDAGRKSVPEGTKFRRVIEDVLASRKRGEKWEQCWKALEDRWGATDRCPGAKGKPFNIDAALNGAYVFMGLVWGDGDIEKSMRIAMRCGQDSDCNPSTVGAILGNWMGLSRLPEKWKSGLVTDRKFAHTDYTFDDVIGTSVALARDVVRMAGGRVSGTGDEVWTVPHQSVTPPIIEQWPAEPDIAPTLSASVVSQRDRSAKFTTNAVDVDGVAAYQWFFGDLSFANGREVTHTYPTPGDYTAICYVADVNGSTSWQAVPVAVR